MSFWLGSLLFESKSAEFRSAYSVSESVDRLAAATKRSAWFALDETSAVGKVSVESVRLQRVIPLIRNSFKPFFIGRFESRDGVTVLTGCFTMSMLVKIFMSFWLAMVAMFAVGFLVGNFNSTTSSSAWAVIGPFLMFAAGLGLVGMGKWLARNDAAWLSSVIAQALEQPQAGAAALEETRKDPAAVPATLKAVALILAASSVIVVAMDFFAPRVLPVSSMILANRALPMVHFVYAIAALAIALGVWRRKPWAWWAGFLVLGLSVVNAVISLPTDAQVTTPPMIWVVFGIFAALVVGVWGRWWYAQRRHFLWTKASTSPNNGRP